jgi:hypothetical protein
MAVTSIFVCAWLPLNVVTLISEYNPDLLINIIGQYHEIIYGILHLFGAANAVTNPILYGYLNENFRNEYKSLYRKMPWYSGSVSLARSLRRSLKFGPSKSHEDNIPLSNYQADRPVVESIENDCETIISRRDSLPLAVSILISYFCMLISCCASAFVFKPLVAHALLYMLKNCKDSAI